MIPDSGFFGVLRAASSRLTAPIDLGSLPFRAANSGALLGGSWCTQGRSADWLTAGTLAVAFHGEIFNADDLRAQLSLAANTPLLQVLLAGWQRWHVQLFPRLDGLFALAVRDGDELTLYRDPSGLCGLYRYHDGRGDVAFATDLDTLLRLPGTQRRLARHSLHEYLRFLEVTAPNTLFENVVAVDAGQALRWPAREEALQPRPSLEPGPTAPQHFAEAVGMLDTHLQRSVKSRLANSVAPAAFLSGGVDSALLCAMASRLRLDTTAVTVGFESPEYDESSVAQGVASHLGMRHEVLHFARSAYLSAFERLSASAEQPTADPASLATLLVAEHCRSRYDIAVDGTGADEAVGMMPPRHVSLAVRSAALLPVGARRGLARLMRAVPGIEGYTPIFDFDHPADTMIRWHGFTRQEIEALCSEPVSFGHTNFFRTFERYQHASPFDLCSALLDAMPSDRLNQAMRISGMVMRFPFYERQTDHFLRSLPIEYRYRPNEPKRILRALLARYVPLGKWAGPKHGFDFPLHDFMAAEDFMLVRRYLGEVNPSLATMLPLDKLQRYAKQFMAGDRRLTFRIWALVVLSAWLRHHGNAR